jgi:hypothetical protein
MARSGPTMVKPGRPTLTSAMYSLVTPANKQTNECENKHVRREVERNTTLTWTFTNIQEFQVNEFVFDGFH